MRYLHEPQSGKPYALNAGIAATSGDLVALIDDDEEVAGDWFVSIEKHFREIRELDFIGGKCLPRWAAPRPAWLGDGYLGVIGWVDPGPHSMVMDASYPGILMGGNAVIRRDALTRAGNYSTAALAHRDQAARVRGRGYVPPPARARRVRPLCPRPRNLPSRTRNPPDQALFPDVVLLARRIARRDGPEPARGRDVPGRYSTAHDRPRREGRAAMSAVRCAGREKRRRSGSSASWRASISPVSRGENTPTSATVAFRRRLSPGWKARSTHERDTPTYRSSCRPTTGQLAWSAPSTACLSRPPTREYEVIVVDNNSTDDTRRSSTACRPVPALRTVVERKQGVSHARNAGIAAARAPIVAFFDDDVRVAPNWIETIIRVFADDPGTEVIGGKVLPDWAAPPPCWLTPAHWAPLALQDLGDGRC